MEAVSDILDTYKKTVNSKEKDLKTVNSEQYTVDNKDLYPRGVDSFLEELQSKPEFVAETLSTKLKDTGDNGSIPYYTMLAKNTPAQILFEALSCTLDAQNRGKIRGKMAIYFLGILRHKKVKVKFNNLERSA